MTDRGLVEKFAADHGLKAEWDGTIGFGRECVGLVDEERDSFVAYANGTGPPAEVKHAYHKDTYIAVLGHADSTFWDREAELAAWVRHLIEVDAHFERLPKVGLDLAAYAFGHMDEMVALPRDDAEARAERERLRTALAGLR